MGWKIYFWIISALIILGLLAPVLVPGEVQNFTLMDWVGMIVSIPSLIGFFAFAYKKRLLDIKFWKIILWVTVTVNAFYLAYPSLPKNIIPDLLRVSTSGIEGLIGIIFELPILYGLYQLAYNQEWYLRKDKELTFSMVSPEKTNWWKASSVAVAIHGVLALLVSAAGEIMPELTSEGRISLAIIGVLQIVVGILIWYRLNLVLLLTLAFFTFRAICLLGGGKFEEFFFNTIVFIILFITTLKTQTKIMKT
jgi:hypothetical protein